MNQERRGQVLKRTGKSDEKSLRFFSLKGLKKSSKDPTQHLAASLKCQVDRDYLCGRVDMPDPTEIK